MNYYNGKVVVITGAGGILCGELAKGYALKGAKVALLDLSYDNAKNKADEIVSLGGIAVPYKCNVLDKQSLEEVRNQINKDLGTCDILINGAGGNSPKANTDNEFFNNNDLGNKKTFFDLDENGIDFVFNLNFKGTLLPSQVFVKDMINKNDASILNISSMNAFTPLTKIPAYSAAKAAVSNFTQWLAVHFAHTSIRCNAIAPGFFVTAQNQKLLFNDDGTPTLRSEKILRNTPMNRFGEANEIIEASLFLTDGQKASFINGVVLPIDGGFSAYSGV